MGSYFWAGPHGRALSRRELFSPVVFHQGVLVQEHTTNPQNSRWMLLFAAWIVSLVGMLVSLFFSEVMSLPPCVLCWYQRVCLYPLVLILATGFLTKDTRVTRYAWPLVIIGLLLALYHNLVFYGVVPKSITPCTEGVPCDTPLLEGMGFISIPLLSLLGFFSRDRLSIFFYC